jgi:hypothetical protein
LHGIEDLGWVDEKQAPQLLEEQEGPGGCSSGGSFAAPQEMENKHDQSDHQQDVDEAGANVKCEKAKQPENNQNQGNKSEHSFAPQGGRGKGSLTTRRAVMVAVRGPHVREF